MAKKTVKKKPAAYPHVTAAGTAMTQQTISNLAPQPDRLANARFISRGTLEVGFLDGKSFRLRVRLLEMPVSEIDWRTAAASSDGTVMIVRDFTGIEIPIDAGAIRCLVDKNYAAKAKAAVDGLQLTREQLRALAEISEPPQGWDASM